MRASVAKRRGGERATGAAAWLGLAATPAFGLMALLTASDGAASSLCSAALGGSPLAGMLPMYLMMGVFHAGPWIRLIGARRVIDRIA